MTRLQCFVTDLQAALDRGLPVTVEDVIDGLETAQRERRRDGDPVRFEIGMERVLDLARRRQDTYDRSSAAIFGEMLARTQK